MEEKWERVTIHDTTKKGGEGNEANKEQTAWKACGSKDTPREEEPTTQKEKQESEADKEARGRR